MKFDKLIDRINSNENLFAGFTDIELTVLDLALSYFKDEFRRNRSVVSTDRQARALYSLHKELLLQKKGDH